MSSSKTLQYKTIKTRKLVTSQSEEDPNRSGEYTVEKILQKRITKEGITEYYLKWKGWSEDDNTWQLEEEVGDPDMVEEFEVREMKKMSMIEKLRKQRQENPKAFRRKKIHLKEGFERGYSPERILGVTAQYGLSFLIKWKGVLDADIVPAAEANEKCPELVIKFYENHLTLEENKSESSKPNKDDDSKGAGKDAVNSLIDPMQNISMRRKDTGKK